MILLDSNILIHGNQNSSPHFPVVTNKLLELIGSNEELIICPQVLYEFYVVATRPASQRGGLGLTNNDALGLIEKFQSVYTFIDDPFDLFINWLGIVQAYSIIGVSGHDARIVAFMKAHQLGKLYTLNSNDFKRYNDIIEMV